MLFEYGILLSTSLNAAKLKLSILIMIWNKNQLIYPQWQGDVIAGVGTDPDGMKIEETVGLIQNIAEQYDIVGLTIAEPMPRIAIKLKNILKQMTLLKE